MREAQILQELENLEINQPWRNWPHDPIGYSENVLGAGRLPGSPPFWWAKQQEIANKLNTPPYRVLVKACHSVGKSHVVAGLINWWFDSFDPGIVLTTAPKYDSVKDVIWKEVRKQRRGREDVFPGPKAPRMETAEDHYATGFTARHGTAVQGQHEKAVLVVIDEAVMVEPSIWESLDSMVMGERYGFLAICNPTDPGSEFYRREQMGGWHVVHIEAFEHPNIIAELAGQLPPYPAAIRLQWLRDRIKEWCTQVDGPPGPEDFLFEGKWWHPGPLAECRLLGRWPSAAGNVWNEGLFLSCEKRAPLPFPEDKPPEIGCDVARFGDDDTAIHGRWGGVSLCHESHNGWAGPQIVGRLKVLAKELCDYANARRNPGLQPFKPTEIPVKVDADGMGGMGVVDWSGGYRFIEMSASKVAYADQLYPNRRSEFWFDLADRAKMGLLSLANLSAEVRLKLRLEALAPSYKLDAAGRRVVEPKADTKGRLTHSPDNMDAANLAYCETYDGVAEWVDPEHDAKVETMGARRGLLGREDSTATPQERPRIRTLGR